MKALRTISGTVLLLIAGFLKMTFSIMQTHLRQVTLKEQLTANYPINQVNDVIETYTPAILWLFFIIGVLLLWPIIYGYVKEQIKLLSSKDED